LATFFVVIRERLSARDAVHDELYNDKVRGCPAVVPGNKVAFGDMSSHPLLRVAR
jgi:hypothetical protein